MEEQEPQWVRVLRRHSRAKRSFGAYVEERIAYLASVALTGSQSFEQVLGMRYAAEELALMRRLMDFEDEEVSRHADI